MEHLNTFHTTVDSSHIQVLNLIRFIQEKLIQQLCMS